MPGGGTEADTAKGLTGAGAKVVPSGDDIVGGLFEAMTSPSVVKLQVTLESRHRVQTGRRRSHRRFSPRQRSQVLISRGRDMACAGVRDNSGEGRAPASNSFKAEEGLGWRGWIGMLLEGDRILHGKVKLDQGRLPTSVNAAGDGMLEQIATSRVVVSTSN